MNYDEAMEIVYEIGGPFLVGEVQAELDRQVTDVSGDCDINTMFVWREAKLGFDFWEEVDRKFREAVLKARKKELISKYHRVIGLCNGTKLEATPWHGVRYRGLWVFEHHPDFDGTRNDKYEFAVAVVEDKPVFIGEILYAKYGNYKDTLTVTGANRAKIECTDKTGLQLSLHAKSLTWYRPVVLTEVEGKAVYARDILYLKGQTSRAKRVVIGLYMAGSTALLCRNANGGTHAVSTSNLTWAPPQILGEVEGKAVYAGDTLYIKGRTRGGKRVIEGLLIPGGSTFLCRDENGDSCAIGPSSLTWTPPQILGEVEGKEVYAGDTLYLKDRTRGAKRVVRELFTLGGRTLMCDNEDGSLVGVTVSSLTWTPPQILTEVEGKAVYAGDVLYLKDRTRGASMTVKEHSVLGKLLCWNEHRVLSSVDLSNLTWVPPKELGVVEYKVVYAGDTLYVKGETRYAGFIVDGSDNGRILGTNSNGDTVKCVPECLTWTPPQILGEVEGKPVYYSDVLYHKASGAKLIALKSNWGSLLVLNEQRTQREVATDRLTWIAPKDNTRAKCKVAVMLQLRPNGEDVRFVLVTTDASAKLVEKRATFIRWLHDDWQTAEV